MTTLTDTFTATPLTGTFGMEFTGTRLAGDLDADWLAGQLDEHLLLVFRDQFLNPAEQVAVARALGSPTPAHPVVPGMDGYPEILELDGAKGGRNAAWHTDVTFTRTPPSASVLVSDVSPVAGGDTLWADLRGAYARLSEPLRHLVDGLEAVHRITPLAYFGEPADTGLHRDDARELLERAAGVPPVIHPVVRVHPTTGRRALFVNPGFTSHLVGLSRVESDRLLALLFDHATQPEVVVRHRWQAGDVVIWDNKATMHYATDDYGTAERRMRRVTIAGCVPRGPSGAESRIVDDPFLAVR
jgi:taurine dioxygenase